MELSEEDVRQEMLAWFNLHPDSTESIDDLLRMAQKKRYSEWSFFSSKFLPLIYELYKYSHQSMEH